MPSVANKAALSGAFAAPPTVIRGEPVALVSTQARSMLHPVRRILAAYYYDASTGARVDHPLSAIEIIDGYRVARTSGSPIYDFADYVVAMSGGTYALVTNTTPRNPPVVMNLLTYLDYETDYLSPETITGLASPAIGGKIITAGDSITGAAHTISREFASSDGDGYVGLIRKQFVRQFSVDNFSIDGSSIGQLTTSLPGLLATNPSMITVAFGQNDHVGGMANIASFEDALNDIVDDCQSAGVRNALIGFMPKNPLWENYSLDDCIAYNDAIEGVATAQGVPFVDIYARWEAVKALKSHLEMTGDNHHHPNNFGSRVYFSAILPYLLTGSVSSADVPGYVVIP